jgi:hydroxypyruvate isomerase
MTRRDILASPAVALGTASAFAQEAKVPRKGRLKQGVCSGVFGREMAFEDRCRHAARLGATGFDLMPEERWPILKKHGLIPTMVPGAGTIKDALNRRENHERLEADMRSNLKKAAGFGCPNVITFSGNKAGMAEPEAIDNCVLFLNKVKAQAEDLGVNICMEYLNSKVNHADYQFDHMSFGVEVCKRVNSPRMKILYDMYHVQIMEGDIIRMMRANIQHIGHFHTAGNPGRHEFDDTQEMNYRGIASAIADLGFQGWVSHEYTPLKDPLQSLDEALRICDV